MSPKHSSSAGAINHCIATAEQPNHSIFGSDGRLALCFVMHSARSIAYQILARWIVYQLARSSDFEGMVIGYVIRRSGEEQGQQVG